MCGMKLSRFRSRALAAALVFGLCGMAPSAAKDDPEAVVRAYVKAMYSNDVAAFEQLTVPDPRRARLVAGGSGNPDKLRQLNEDPTGLQIRMKKPFSYHGEPAKPDASGAYPVGATVTYMVAHYGSPTMFSLVRKADGWKIDLRWWLAMMDAASGAESDRGSPQFAVRSFTAALMALDRDKVAALTLPPANMDVLFAGAPSSREPSGHMEALAYEMGLVEIGAGEFAKLPSGRVIEGGGPEDRKVLVGLLGPLEVAYVLRRVDGEWKVLAEPYFVQFNQ